MLLTLEWEVVDKQREEATEMNIAVDQGQTYQYEFMFSIQIQVTTYINIGSYGCTQVSIQAYNILLGELREPRSNAIPGAMSTPCAQILVISTILW